MGVRSSIYLYFPLDRLECAIKKIAALSEQATSKRMTIRLPNGDRIALPHSGFSVPDKTKRSLSGDVNEISYTTAFLLSKDAVIGEYLARYEPVEPINSTGKYGIGNFQVILSTGNNYAEITLSAVTSSQNRILLESNVLHQHLLHILKGCKGLFVLVDTGMQSCYLLTNITKEISVHTDDVDSKVNEIQQQINA